MVLIASHYWHDLLAGNITWPSDPIKSVLQGQGVPAASATATSTASAQLTAFESSLPGTTTSGGTTGGGGKLGKAAASMFAKGVLAAIGAPQTAANTASLQAWAAREGGGGANNPLNTTLAYGGGTNFNSAGVKNYPSLATGIKATARTLLGSGYGDLLAAFRSGRGLCGHSYAGLSKWSGGGYSQVC